MGELLGFFNTLMNIQGSKTNEAVLQDPETIEWMASQKGDSDSGVPIFGNTEIVSLLKTLIEVQAGKELYPRPKIPGLELRKRRKIAKTKSSIEKAQERARLRREQMERKLSRQESKGS